VSDGGWHRPGRGGAALYALAAAVVATVTTIFSRLQVARVRSRRKVAETLPPGAIIVISNHTSYADGVLLSLVCKRMGRQLRLLATGGVFRAPVLGGLLRRIGFGKARGAGGDQMLKHQGALLLADLQRHLDRTVRNCKRNSIGVQLCRLGIQAAG